MQPSTNRRYPQSHHRSESLSPTRVGIFNASLRICSLVRSADLHSGHRGSGGELMEGCACPLPIVTVPSLRNDYDVGWTTKEKMSSDHVTTNGFCFTYCTLCNGGQVPSYLPLLA